MEQSSFFQKVKYVLLKYRFPFYILIALVPAFIFICFYTFLKLNDIFYHPGDNSIYYIFWALIPYVLWIMLITHFYNKDHEAVEITEKFYIAGKDFWRFFWGCFLLFIFIFVVIGLNKSGRAECDALCNNLYSIIMSIPWFVGPLAFIWGLYGLVSRKFHRIKLAKMLLLIIAFSPILFEIYISVFF